MYLCFKPNVQYSDIGKHNYFCFTCFHLCFDYVADQFIYRNAKPPSVGFPKEMYIGLKDIKGWVRKLQPAFCGSMEMYEASRAVW